jgi:hypothetical protein
MYRTKDYTACRPTDRREWAGRGRSSVLMDARLPSDNAGSGDSFLRQPVHEVITIREQCQLGVGWAPRSNHIAGLSRSKARNRNGLHSPKYVRTSQTHDTPEYYKIGTAQTQSRRLSVITASPTSQPTDGSGVRRESDRVGSSSAALSIATRNSRHKRALPRPGDRQAPIIRPETRC